MILLLLACSLLDQTVGCDFRNGSLNGPEDRCQDRDGAQATGFDAACEAAGGEVVDGGCPTDGVVAGCELEGGSAAGTVTDWYYGPETVESVTAECDGEGELVEI